MRCIIFFNLSCFINLSLFLVSYLVAIVHTDTFQGENMETNVLGVFFAVKCVPPAAGL